MIPRPDDIRACQLRAGRALLGWTVADLSEASGIPVATIKRAEAAPDVIPVKPVALLTIVHTMYSRGIVLTRDLSRIGVAQDLRKR